MLKIICILIFTDFFLFPCIGISVTDMGKKTVGNDLDNASIKFENLTYVRALHVFFKLFFFVLLLLY